MHHSCRKVFNFFSKPKLLFTLVNTKKNFLWSFIDFCSWTSCRLQNESFERPIQKVFNALSEFFTLFTLTASLLRLFQVKFWNTFVAHEKSLQMLGWNDGDWGKSAQFFGPFHPRHKLHCPHITCHI